MAMNAQFLLLLLLSLLNLAPRLVSPSLDVRGKSALAGSAVPYFYRVCFRPHGDRTSAGLHAYNIWTVRIAAATSQRRALGRAITCDFLQEVQPCGICSWQRS